MTKNTYRIVALIIFIVLGFVAYTTFSKNLCNQNSASILTLGGVVLGYFIGMSKKS